MARDVNLTSQAWCELVFEGKNKEYGAYALRQKSSDRHLKALMIVLTAIAIVMSGARLAQSVSKAQGDAGESYREVVTMKPIDLLPPKEEMDLKVEKPELPPVKLKEVIAYTAPKITKEAPDDSETMRTQDELNRSQAIIGSKDIEGVNDKDAVNPKDLDNLGAVTGGGNAAPATFEVAEIMPTYPGGDGELLKYLSSNIRYPVIDLENNVQGRVVLRFVVGEDGAIRDIVVLRSLSASCDKEAIRVVKSMSKWIPGRQNGKAVPVYFSLPIKFAIQNN